MRTPRELLWSLYSQRKKCIAFFEESPIILGMMDKNFLELAVKFAFALKALSNLDYLPSLS